MDITEVLKKAKRPERTVQLCLDANLAAEHDELSQQLADEQRTTRVTMADSNHTAELSQAIADVEERMRASLVTFRMRGLPYFEREKWLEAHPAREGKNELFNPVTGTVPLIAACCVDPAMTEAQALELVEVLGTGQTDKLWAAAWQATNGDDAVPFSVAASVNLRGSGPKQK